MTLDQVQRLRARGGIADDAELRRLGQYPRTPSVKT